MENLNETDLYSCRSCNVGFTNSADHKLHYREDFHRYNLKRRTLNLGPISYPDFDKRKKAALALQQHKLGLESKGNVVDNDGNIVPGTAKNLKCMICNKNFNSLNMYEQHCSSKKHKEREKSNEKERNTRHRNKGALNGDNMSQVELLKDKSSTDIPEEKSMPVQAVKSPKDQMLLEDDASVESEGSVSSDSELLKNNCCIFCDKISLNLEENVQHMLLHHGFFIPDAEYLVNLKSLVQYCSEKVKLGNICLYCNGKGKTFYSHKDVQAHMISKSHCKLLYEEGEDLHEFSDFYDFTSTWKKRKRSLKKKQNTSTTSSSVENKEIVTEEEPVLGEEDDDDEDDWVTDDEEMEDDEDIGEDGSVSDSEEESDYDDDAAYIASSGELVLPNGRILGHRQYKRLYKQKFRRTPEEVSEALVAVRSEKHSKMVDNLTASLTSKGFSMNNKQIQDIIAKGGLSMMSPSLYKKNLKVQEAERRKNDKYVDLVIVDKKSKRFWKRSGDTGM